MDETFMKARAYLAQNYSDPELSLTDLCHYLGFSCSYFSTLFKQKTGLNYSRYITSLRLEQAAKLLTDTDDTALCSGDYCRKVYDGQMGKASGGVFKPVGFFAGEFFGHCGHKSIC